ncbi:uncharacterized protein PHALS_02590 [Plasmopara halstedii]|uniref:Uncharacterized protein n=1 Tax=Plasmopara halstedii TaxID=4781 RepID=A0A0P1AY73_PLAHL|nr:uncharacterized protein PHALS_02590 [Plasmopara halstedii]CEG46175.1 hypothetical protein PHALS_02590 [Plasmopara halstedii]|eukprot:XP_024582544.1 hypothetical protein PHALS_02590 [Plasmopara halstedii]
MRHENSCTNHIFTWRLTVTGGEALLKMGSTVARETKISALFEEVGRQELSVMKD